MHKVKFHNKGCSGGSGFSLVELLVSLGILGVTVAGLLSFISNQTDLIKSINLRLRIASVRNELLRNVDCIQTIGPFRDVNGNVSCDSTFALINNSGSPLLDSTGHITGGDPNWVISASCGTNSIEIAGSLSAGGAIVRDKILGSINSSNTKVNPIIGSNVAFKLCHNMFGQGMRTETKMVNASDFVLNAGDCTAMSVRLLNQIDPTKSLYLTETVSPLQIAINKCSAYCTKNNYVSGFISNCTDSQATCECLR